MIARAYRALDIPKDHILIFDGGIAGAPADAANPYHGSTAHSAEYVDEWRQLYGSPDQ